jgi:hypothetical protein
MARNATRKRQSREPPAHPAAPNPNLGYDPSGKMEPIDIVSSKDGWSEYTLEDGTILRVKAALLDVKRAVDQYSIDGDPIYLINAALVNQVRAPDKLKQKK